MAAATVSVIHGFHPLPGERAGVLDLLRAIGIGPGMNDTARAEVLLEFGIVGIILVLGFLLGVQMIEVPEEFVEAVHGREMFVAVALMILAELASDIALRLENPRHGHIGLLPAFLRTGNANLGHARAKRIVAADEGRTARGAALLSIVVGESHALGCDTVNIGRAITHKAAVVVTDVCDANVIAPDHKDVGLCLLGPHGYRLKRGHQGGKN